MKVLFAVNDENISSEIVKKYQREYKEIISYKNVYFYNAILKELQRDKTYDRIVISEDLEEFTSSSYDQRDKFIFDKLDEISDEASNAEHDNIDIIVISSERRTKSDSVLVRFFGIGIYNAIIGKDRSIDEVCKLINKPRTKKQAKIYYGIETEEVNYKPENENNVDEEEMRNILNHFKKLGKNENQYVQSFNNIVSQYNENQLKIIVKMLPLNVKAVLEENSPEYQKIATSNGMRKKELSARQKINKITGPSEKLFTSNGLNKTSKPVVVPTTMEKSNVKRVITSKIKPASVTYKEDIEDIDEFDDLDDIINGENLTKPIEIEEVKPRKRGRPRKNATLNEEVEIEKPRKRGRPKKQNNDENQEFLPGFDTQEEVESILPGFEQDDDEYVNQIVPHSDTNDNEEEENIGTLPGFEQDDEAEFLPGFDDDNEEYDSKNSFSGQLEDEDKRLGEEEDNNYYENNQQVSNNYQIEENSYNNFDKEAFESLLTPGKKIVAFLGTTKNGTSFVVNNVAEFLSKSGVNVAILDATKNKNAYYIYTKNDETLRQTAINSFQNLIMGNPYGVQVNSSLTVYTGIPSETEQIKNYGSILETLVKNHTCVLIDCDFSTPKEYFEFVQQIFLVQSMDILTIQPLTAFLKELKAKNILDENKINIVLNKVVRLKNVSTKNIVGGLAFYNDPEMSFMTELFDRNKVSSIEIPFNEEVYTKYLSGIVDCDISINNYPKDFKNIIGKLADKVYQLVPRKSGSHQKNKNISSGPSYANSFSSSMNNTLNTMKNKY